MPPIHWAAAKGDLEEVSALLSGNRAPSLLLDHLDSTGKTPLVWAVCGNYVKVAHTLISCGANVHVADVDRWGPLHFSCGGAPRELVLMLLQAGADPLSRDRWGQTCLMLAAEAAPEDVVACLLRHLGSAGGRGINSMDHERRTALHRYMQQWMA